LALDCQYTDEGKLKLKNIQPDYFDSGDYRILIEKVFSEINDQLLENYMTKNNGVYYLAILNFLVDKIPGLFSVKFVSSSDESIYYATELNK